ncbi:MAG: glycerol-3-phosphate 1-O-acyltransferase PlsY [Alphaproteobacteria bacterium]|nr:glycerol-3-phosphate 1-O-acyltransferase PlsY [Alphaproteobacteria bacterium]
MNTLIDALAPAPGWLIALAAIAGYGFGSIPFGLVLTRLAGLGDIRKIGSGNIGATNVLRTGRKDLALATLLLDGGKGAIAVIFARLIGDGAAAEPVALLAGLFAVVGHNFPIWLGFKGGKGMATTLGTIIAAVPLVGGMACVTWLAIALIYRYSSLSALIALLMAPAYAYILDYPYHAIIFAVLGLLGWIRHHANLRRLLTGQEPRIGAKTS